MKISLTSLSVLLLGCGLLAGASSCRVEAATAKKFVGTEETMSEGWQSGGDVVIEGVYGNITVVPGSADTVQVTFTPFNYGAFDKKEEAFEDLDRYKQLVVESRSDGGVHISTGRTGGGNGIGADIEVALPSNFDEALTVRNRSEGPINPGYIDVQSVGAATSVEVSTDSLGDCNVNGAPSLASTTAHCDGDIVITGASAVFDVVATGLEHDITLTVPAVAAGTCAAPGCPIHAEKGNINLTMPAAGDYSVMAWPRSGGTLDEGTLPADCSSEPSPDGGPSRTITCGAGGPLYDVQAGTDANFEYDITLDYQ